MFAKIKYVLHVLGLSQSSFYFGLLGKGLNNYEKGSKPISAQPHKLYYYCQQWRTLGKYKLEKGQQNSLYNHASVRGS